MDTTETYIKMRIEAIPDLGRGDSPRSVGHEIQWLPESHEGIFIDTNGNYFIATKLGACQLERQDQLQVMITEIKLCDFEHPISQPSNQDKLLALWEFSKSDSRAYFSMEQLWLAFVMKEKYSKSWDGEDWVILN